VIKYIHKYENEILAKHCYQTSISYFLRSPADLHHSKVKGQKLNVFERRILLFTKVAFVLSKYTQKFKKNCNGKALT